MKNRGITLFIAVVIMAILLLVSFAVVDIAIKSTFFASTGKDSQQAFFAADAGVECAIFWDSSAEESKFSTSTSGVSISCAGNTINDGQAIQGTSTVTRLGGGGNANPVSVFGFVMNTGSNPSPNCAIVTVTKNPDYTTDIASRGYNTCDTNNPRRVERGLEVTY